MGIKATIGLAEHLAVTDPLLMRSVLLIFTIESRHNAFFRYIQGEIPNLAPFDTGISDIWAYNLGLSFIVPGSYPIKIPLPILLGLTIAQLVVKAFANSTERKAQ